MLELDLPKLNAFLRLAIGGWSSLPIQLAREEDNVAIKNAIQLLDPEEKYWHLEGDILWRKDEWLELWNKAQERRVKREEEIAITDKRRKKIDEFILAIQQKLGMTREMAEKVAIPMMKNQQVELVKEHFGVDIGELKDDLNNVGTYTVIGENNQVERTI